jgi:peroxiredoxin
MTPKLHLEAVQAAFDRCRTMDASLGERLAAFAQALRKVNPSFAAAADRMIQRLQQTGVGADAPRAGDPMPEFLLPDDTGRLVSLEELLRHGPVAIAFHRGHWCPYCRLNTDALAAADMTAQTVGAQIVAITPERQQFAAALKPKAHARFRVLTDMDNGYALSLNLVFWVGEEMKRFIAGLGRNVAEYQGNESWMLPIPATFVVRTDGRIEERFLDPDYRKRMEIDDLLGALQRARQA